MEFVFAGAAAEYWLYSGQPNDGQAEVVAHAPRDPAPPPPRWAPRAKQRAISSNAVATKSSPAPRPKPRPALRDRTNTAPKRKPKAKTKIKPRRQAAAKPKPARKPRPRRAAPTPTPTPSLLMELVLSRCDSRSCVLAFSGLHELLLWRTVCRDCRRWADAEWRPLP